MNKDRKLATYSLTQEGLPDKGREIEGLVVCWVLLNLIILG